MISLAVMTPKTSSMTKMNDGSVLSTRGDLEDYVLHAGQQ
jgi:hypothetical protein